MYLILFDIDGTLLWSDGAGRRAMERALVEVFGAAGPAGYRYDGKTDRQIVRELMRAEGHDDERIDAAMERLTERYLAELEVELGLDDAQVQLLPGVRELLDALEMRADVVLGLLTGNLAGGAAAKLRAAGLDIARFKVAVFGSDHEHRPALPALARDQARGMIGAEFPGDRIVIIGDTPHDIACGREIGARAIGVATGRYPMDELREHRPTAVFPDLRDTAAVVAAVLAA